MQKERRKMERFEDVAKRNNALINTEIEHASAERNRLAQQCERMKQLALIRCPNDPGLVQCLHKLIEKFTSGVSVDRLREAIVRCEPAPNGNGTH